MQLSELYDTGNTSHSLDHTKFHSLIIVTQFTSILGLASIYLKSDPR
jgi:hypothetical protein